MGLNALRLVGAGRAAVIEHLHDVGLQNILESMYISTVHTNSDVS